MTYVRALILLAVLAGLAGWSVFMYRQGGKSARLECVQREAAELREALKERDEAIEARNRAQAKVDALDKPQSKVVNDVRANPSGCALPRPVADSLREQVRATNAAIRSVR